MTFDRYVGPNEGTNIYIVVGDKVASKKRSPAKPPKAPKMERCCRSWPMQNTVRGSELEASRHTPKPGHFPLPLVTHDLVSQFHKIVIAKVGLISEKYHIPDPLLLPQIRIWNPK